MESLRKSCYNTVSVIGGSYMKKLIRRPAFRKLPFLFACIFLLSSCAAERKSPSAGAFVPEFTKEASKAAGTDTKAKEIRGSKGDAGTVFSLPYDTGYYREKAEKGSFQRMVQDLPLNRKGNQIQPVIMDQNLLKKPTDLVLLLYADYFFGKEDYDRFFFADGNKNLFSYAEFVKKRGKKNGEIYEEYLKDLFAKTNLSTIQLESKVQGELDLNSGDIYLRGNQVFLILDVLRKDVEQKVLLASFDEKTGETVLLQEGGSYWLSPEELMKNGSFLRPDYIDRYCAGTCYG